MNEAKLYKHFAFIVPWKGEFFGAFVTIENDKTVIRLGDVNQKLKEDPDLRTRIAKMLGLLMQHYHYRKGPINTALRPLHVSTNCILITSKLTYDILTNSSTNAQQR